MTPECVPEVGADATTKPDLSFVKYSMCGNTFIIVDETRTPLADDVQRAAFARWALDERFGIGGSDNVLYLHDPPAAGPSADRALRVFEHDGCETLSCGNGLLSVAALLKQVDSRREWMVLTEIPSGTPHRVCVGTGPATDETRVDFGSPRSFPKDLFTGTARCCVAGIERIGELEVPLSRDDASALPADIVLSGFLVFTGEPHLVLVATHGLSEELADRILPAPADGGTAGRAQAASESDRLVDRIGRSLNVRHRSLFPQGVHLDFARVRPELGVIEYRTYERAIDRETLACGSGAVAIVAVARWLGLVSGSHTTLWPHRCRRHDARAALTVSQNDTGFVLRGSPRLVYSGVVARGAFA